MSQNSKYQVTIGLEVHAELKTLTKMFCACKNDPDEERPNVNICPICLGHPGTLPVINKEAVKKVLQVGLAVGGQLADFTEFDRKNYFYPDIPKGYQISQYKYPLVSGGELLGFKLTRIHLEEDTGTSSHDKGDYSLVDFNRAGVPLMELVTEPVFHSAEEVSRFGRELQILLQTLGASDANMEKGEMRLEANISVSENDKLGTKVEIKNLNSFRAAERAIAYEVKRQSALLEKGDKVAQETRGWDEVKQATFSQRSKEDSHDYRYFPDPDLPKLKLSRLDEFDIKVLKRDLRETPAEKRTRLTTWFGLKVADIEFFIFNPSFAKLFEAAVVGLSDKANAQLLANYLVSDLSGLGADPTIINPTYLAKLVNLIAGGQVSSRGAKDILAKMVVEGGDPEEIGQREGLFQQSDRGALEGVAKEVIAANQDAVLEYKNGKLASLQFLIGQGMKATRGSGNPQVFKEIFESLLK